MEIEKYSPKWLLEKINDSKTDAHKLMHIIKYKKELVESTEQQLILSGVSNRRELLIADIIKMIKSYTDEEVNLVCKQRNEMYGSNL
jgi:hypothetical protein